MLLEAIKSHGIEWVRQRITGAGSVSPMPQESQVRSPKRARKVPARYRDTDAQPAQHRASTVENIVLVPHKKVESPVLGTGGAPPAPVVLNAAPIQSPAVGGATNSNIGPIGHQNVVLKAVKQEVQVNVSGTAATLCRDIGSRMSSSLLGLRMEIKEKIWSGKCCDIFSLSDTEFVSKSDKKWTGRTLQNWTTGFCAYASVICERQPTLAPQLFAYMRLICGAERDFSGNAWLQYDAKFRWLKALDPEMAWDEIQTGLWFEMVKSTLIDMRSAKSPQKGRECWEYNKNACRKGDRCKFEHTCTFCGSRGHPEFRCFKKHGNGRRRIK
ncbi:uncharacterized protein [Pleurodeles waltl]|uniref:uncharacterized protein n=1 Tax=Pleurodeles waltl TaxID=8319 RepID=UPI0037098F54